MITYKSDTEVDYIWAGICAGLSLDVEEKQEMVGGRVLPFRAAAVRLTKEEREVAL